MNSDVVQRKKKRQDSDSKVSDSRKDEISNKKLDKKTRIKPSFFWKFVKIVALTSIPVVLTLIGVHLFVDSPINAVSYKLPPPPQLDGPLAPNDVLSKAEHLFEGSLIGPESLCFVDDSIFTSTYDGQIVEIKNDKIVRSHRLGKMPCGTYEDEPTCGRPLGIKKLDSDWLIVADAYLGLFKLNRFTGESKRLVKNDAINGKQLSFLNDVAVSNDGKIFFTDSSSKWQRRNFIMNVLEHSNDGRLLMYDMKTEQLKVLLNQLHFPNGVHLSKNEDFLLVSETTNARILKYHLKGEKSGKLETFVENLPGLPDNIRVSHNGSYWIAMAGVRRPQKISLIDLMGTYTGVRNFITKIIPAKYIGWLVAKTSPKYGLAVLVDGNGKYVSSLHDPTGIKVPTISEIEDNGKSLFIGSYHSPFLAKLDY